MKYFFLVLLSVFSLRPVDTQLVDLKIVVTNINVLEGSIELGIFNTPKSFLKKGKEYKLYTQKVSSDTLIFLLTGLKKDDYAISLYHDINSDSKCNLNFLGIPLEPYGFSRNFKPKFSKPSFNDCKINASQNKPITIELIDKQHYTASNKTI